MKYTVPRHFNYRIAPVKTGDNIFTVKAVEKDPGNGRNFYDMSVQKVLPDSNAESVTVFDMLNGVKKSEKAGGGQYVEPKLYPAGGIFQLIGDKLGIYPNQKRK